MLTERLRQKRVDGSCILLETLEAQQRIGFREIVTGDESWIYLDTNPDSIWIGAKKKVPCDCAQ
jgi:hypothetical protein